MAPEQRREHDEGASVIGAAAAKESQRSERPSQIGADAQLSLMYSESLMRPMVLSRGQDRISELRVVLYSPHRSSRVGLREGGVI